ncbi:MAG: hypothetical protein LBL45_01220 [Treponema sp.]|nr:hypothetical protein [Treponema sp.]
MLVEASRYIFKLPLLLRLPVTALDMKVILRGKPMEEPLCVPHDKTPAPRLAPPEFRDNGLKEPPGFRLLLFGDKPVCFIPVEYHFTQKPPPLRIAGFQGHGLVKERVRYDAEQHHRVSLIKILSGERLFAHQTYLALIERFIAPSIR